MNRQRGFTLIELLVVIAVVAVLMAVLLPALHRARMRGQRVVCGTRSKEIGTSLRTCTTISYRMIRSDLGWIWS
ncbi:MAG: prepilin-type N-terminal cleavage/methylation domain-containing protein [Planctomycetes bacterium]|nr:prepilin-type N-terminal cleavage/methylation domain-containing protein [Planctomycetota bacterium]